MKNEWKELDKHITDLLNKGTNDTVYFDTDEVSKYSARIKNYVQKERILAKIKENHQWVIYFQTEEINLPKMAKHFDAMNMKLQSLLTRFN